MSFKSYQDGTIVIHGGSVPKKPTIGTPEKKPDYSQVIHNAKVENEEIGLTRISLEFTQALINGRKNMNTEEKSFTRKDLATKTCIPLQVINGYETVGTIIDNQFQTNCAKIKKVLCLTTLPKLVALKLKPEE